MLKEQWIVYNERTHSYDTKDGTSIPAELVDNAQCLADVMYVAVLRAEQRSKIKKDKL